MAGQGEYEIGVALRAESPVYTVEMLVLPDERTQQAEGLIEISPPVLVGSALAKAMKLRGYDTHGATFEDALADVEVSSQVVVTAEVQRAPGQTPGFVEGYGPITKTAKQSWEAAVESLRKYLNNEDPTGQTSPSAS